jgi:AcrR family transcriptional regulator
MRARTQQRGEIGDARRTILEACQTLVVENGFDGLSIRRLSDRCGYTAPTIYHHFGDKRGLTDALLEDCFRRLLVRLRRVRRYPDPVDTVRERLRAFVRFGRQNPDHYRLMASRPPDAPEPLQAMEDSRALLEEPLHVLHAAGRLTHDDVEAIIQSFWAMAHGIVTLGNARPDIDWAPDLTDVALDAILYGAVRSDTNAEQEPSS